MIPLPAALALQAQAAPAIDVSTLTTSAPFAGGFAAGGVQTVDQRNPNDTLAIEVSLKLTASWSRLCRAPRHRRG